MLAPRSQNGVQIFDTLFYGNVTGDEQCQIVAQFVACAQLWCLCLVVKGGFLMRMPEVRTW